MNELIHNEFGLTAEQALELDEFMLRSIHCKKDEDFAKMLSWLSKRNCNTNEMAYTIFQATRYYLNFKYANKLQNLIIE